MGLSVSTLSSLKNMSSSMRYVPCKCGHKKVEVIGFETSPVKKTLVPVRKGWYCVECHAWEDAILRETVVEND